MTDFAAILESWYQSFGRELPWRATDDPYRIWISEIILQQTRVNQGYDYYLKFIKRFPTVEALGLADIDDVMLQWQGLGYYSRARNLHAAAKSIVEAGAFPTTYEGVRALKGVGEYTAAAICSFAYGMPYAVIDGNVYRVLSRVFGIKTPIDTTTGKKEFAAVANELLDVSAPALYNQAIMDFGAMVCTPQRPACADCPIAAFCVAHAEGMVDYLPVKSKKTAVRKRFFNYIILIEENEVYIHRRGEGDIWTGLYEPVLLETSTEQTDVATLIGAGYRVLKCVEGLKHQLTHLTLLANAYLVEHASGAGKRSITKNEDNLQKAILDNDYFHVSINGLDDYACSRLVNEIYKQLLGA